MKFVTALVTVALLGVTSCREIEVELARNSSDSRKGKSLSNVNKITKVETLNHRDRVVLPEDINPEESSYTSRDFTDWRSLNPSRITRSSFNGYSSDGFRGNQQQDQEEFITVQDRCPRNNFLGGEDKEEVVVDPQNSNPSYKPANDGQQYQNKLNFFNFNPNIASSLFNPSYSPFQNGGQCQQCPSYIEPTKQIEDSSTRPKFSLNNPTQEGFQGNFDNNVNNVQAQEPQRNIYLQQPSYPCPPCNNVPFLFCPAPCRPQIMYAPNRISRSPGTPPPPWYFAQQQLNSPRPPLQPVCDFLLV